MLIKRKSLLSGKIASMELDVTLEQIEEYQSDRNHAQTIFPHLNSSELEFIQSGITPDEWFDTYGGVD